MNLKMKESVSNFYDRRGHHALSHASSKFGAAAIPLFCQSPYRQLEKKWAKLLASESTVLDIGTGTGLHAIYPALCGAFVEGLDVSEKSIEAAKQLAKTNGVSDQTNFQVANVDSGLPFSDNSFDAILISGSLYYFNIEKLMPEILRVLKPKGSFIALETNGDNFLLNGYRRLKNKRISHRDESTLKKLLGKREIKKLSSYFKYSKSDYYDITAFLTASLKWNKTLERHSYFIFSRIDSLLVKFPFFWRLSFKFIFTGQAPKYAKKKSGLTIDD
jgi:ubiquinone/menaquinone biosynthesis C-methylase UbiE